MNMYLQENDRFRYYFKNNNKDNIAEDFIKFLKMFINKKSIISISPT